MNGCTCTPLHLQQPGPIEFCPLHASVGLSKYGRGLRRLKLDVKKQNRGNALTRWMSVGLAISPDTDDLRQLIKREIWTRGKTIEQFSEAAGFNHSYVTRVLSRRGLPSGSPGQRITPPFLNTVVRVMAIPPAVARRMHTLGARDAGWKL